MRYALFATSMLALGAPLVAWAIAPAAAQTMTVDGRVTKLEKEMRAVQRKVFPGGTPIEPTITRPDVQTPAPGSPASSPVADLMSRVTALESQLASMTGQIEQNSYKLRQLEEAFNRYKADAEARAAASAPPAPRPAPSAVAAAGDTAVIDPKPANPRPAATPAASEERKRAVAAIERPVTGNDAEDAYTFGYRLWDAKFYPEAQTQLKATVDKFGSNAIASKAQNLLGRAYLDDGKPALASVAFYENYQKRPRGERAADSLAYLGESLIQLKKPADACKVFSELEDVYGATMSSSVRAMMAKGRTRANCSA
ncbi:MAG: hypothetical protein ABW164_08980 [Sphingobium sp.]